MLQSPPSHTSLEPQQSATRGSLDPERGVRQLSRNGYTLSRRARSAERPENEG